jgi:hypothetical protein
MAFVGGLQGASRMLSQRMADELMNMSLDEAMPLTRALGHYLGLTSIAELHHRQVAAAAAAVLSRQHQARSCSCTSNSR